LPTGIPPVVADAAYAAAIAAVAAAPPAGTDVFYPGWSPEEMRDDMRQLEDAAEGLIAALRGKKAALGGCRHCWLLPVPGKFAAAAPAENLLPPAAGGLTDTALALMRAPSAIPDRILQREALKSCLFEWLARFVWGNPSNWLKVGLQLLG
jgi:hypothetical protein